MTQHLDTYGKLVSPDTWVVAKFPPGSSRRSEANRLANKLKKLTSPYGTPYKVFRLPMYDRYPYINSLISNRVVFMPAVGNWACAPYYDWDYDEWWDPCTGCANVRYDQSTGKFDYSECEEIGYTAVQDHVLASRKKDSAAERVYRQALPGYKVEKVDMFTAWDDSLHCRTRNIHSKNAIYVFPKVTRVGAGRYEIEADVYPSRGASIRGLPELRYRINGGRWRSVAMNKAEREFAYARTLRLSPGQDLSLYIEARDSKGRRRTEPDVAPRKTIDLRAR